MKNKYIIFSILTINITLVMYYYICNAYAMPENSANMNSYIITVPAATKPNITISFPYPDKFKLLTINGNYPYIMQKYDHASAIIRVLSYSLDEVLNHKVNEKDTIYILNELLKKFDVQKDKYDSYALYQTKLYNYPAISFIAYFPYSNENTKQIAKVQRVETIINNMLIILELSINAYDSGENAKYLLNHIFNENEPIFNKIVEKIKIELNYN